MAKQIIEKGKVLIKSRTFWFNILAVVVAIASLFGFADFQPDGKVIEAIGIITAIVNIYLRTKTDKPITKLL